MTQPETMKGKAAGKKYFAAMTTAFPDVKVSTQNAWGVGDFVIAEGTITRHAQGRVLRHPADEEVRSTCTASTSSQFKDGKIVSGRSYGNGAEMMMQLGLMPQPGAVKDAKPAAKTDAKGAPAGKTDAKPARRPRSPRGARSGARAPAKK